MSINAIEQGINSCKLFFEYLASVLPKKGVVLNYIKQKKKKKEKQERLAEQGFFLARGLGGEENDGRYIK